MQKIVNLTCGCDNCTTRTREMYYLNARCGNCDTTFLLKCRKGDRPGYSIRCPSCQVEGAWSTGKLADRPSPESED